jgi:nucleoside-diphosphate-sugar epimerase
MAKYLITGIAGFIGSSIAHELVRRGETVRGLDDFSTGKWQNIADIGNDIDFREASLLDKAGVASACDGIDFVIHQAALPSVPKSVVEPELTHAVNVNGTLNLLLAARDAGVKRVVYAASSSAYGESEVLPKREDMLPRPISPYAVQKLTGEYYLQTFAKVYGAGCELTIFRRAGQVYYPDATGRVAHDLWRWRAEPRLHVCRQRCAGEPEGMRRAGRRSIRARVQHRNRHKVFIESNL